MTDRAMLAFVCGPLLALSLLLVIGGATAWGILVAFACLWTAATMLLPTDRGDGAGSARRP